MKRIALTLLTAVASLVVPIGGSAAPASAAGCGTGNYTGNRVHIRTTSTLRTRPVYPGDPSCGMVHRGSWYYVRCAVNGGNGWVWLSVRGDRGLWGWLPSQNTDGADHTIFGC